MNYCIQDCMPLIPIYLLATEILLVVLESRHCILELVDDVCGA